MARHTARPSRPQPGQIPLLPPDVSWTMPSELPDVRGGRVSLDLETKDDGLANGRGPGWPYKSGYICGMGLAWGGGAGYYPCRHPDTPDQYTPDQLGQWVEDHKRAGTTFVFQNAPYDLGWMATDWGVSPPDEIVDAIAMAVMVDENRLSYKLDDLCRWRGIPGKDEQGLREAAEAYVVDPKAGIHLLPARFVGPYGTQDPVAALGLVDSLMPVIDREGTGPALQLELDLIPMVLEMRRRGVRLNLDRADQARTELLARRDEVLADLGHRLGRSVTIDHCRSPQHMERWFDDNNIGYPTTPKTRRGSFQAGWMRNHNHWLPSLVARAEQLTEAADKFIKGFLMDYAHRGRLHANINQYRSEEGGTRSHRFSYSDPPLQQMPARDEELSTLIRGLFEPEEGEVWMAADYSQQEYRLIVHFANLMDLRGADAAARRYHDDPRTDFHLYVSEITELERKPAKDTNFAKAFGAGVPKFAQMIGRSEDEAREIYEQYDRELPFVSLLARECQSLAGRRGFIRLLDGARSHFDMWEPAKYQAVYRGGRPLEQAKKLWPGERLRRADTHKAMNRLIQGSAARQTKMAMRECWREGLVPMLQMHDELDHSVGRERDGERVREIMRDTVRLSVPVNVDVEFGVNWGHARALKDGSYGATYEEAVAALAGLG